MTYRVLDGRLSEKEKFSIVEQFNEDKKIQVLLMTTQVGGLGLNFADVVCSYMSDISIKHRVCCLLFVFYADDSFGA